MGCVERGDLRAFLDEELPGAERVRIEEHLLSCTSCCNELEALRVNAAFAMTAFDRVAPRPVEVPQPSWSRIRARAEGRRPVTPGWGLSQMLRNLFGFAGGSRLRAAASTATVLAIVALLFTFSPVQTVASSFLSIFRVQKFVAVQVDPSSLPKMAAPGELGSLTTTGNFNPRQVTAAEAEKAIGFKAPAPGTLPAGIESNPRAFTVTEARSTTFTPDLKKVRAYLSSIGAADVKLPENLDGASITLQLPAGVQVLYAEKGAINSSSEGVPIPAQGQKFLYVGATGSPTLDVPEGLDVEQIRAQALKMPGLPAELVSQLKAVDDWRSTVVVPVVKGTSREVKVQGATGLAITQPDGKGTSLLWPKDGRIYAVSGSFGEAELLAVANSIK